MKPIHLYQLNSDPATEQHLLELTLRHLKLAVEHGRLGCDQLPSLQEHLGPQFLIKIYSKSVFILYGRIGGYFELMYK